MALPNNFQRAMLYPVNPDGKLDLEKKLQVHFNPETLRLQHSNNLQADTRGKGANSQPSQHVDTSAAKLTLDLLFDTTVTRGDDPDSKANSDVTVITKRLVDLYISPPKPESGGDPPAARGIIFLWGKFRFDGLVESMSETLEFFSAGGIPLRASVSLSLTENRYKAKLDDPAAVPPQALPAVRNVPFPSALQAAGLNPKSWRDTALFNGLETPRFSAGAVALGSVSGQLGASAQVSASVGFSAGASADLGTAVPGAFSAGASASISVSGGASAGLGGAASVAGSGGISFG
jgi:hypothetical protein